MSLQLAQLEQTPEIAQALGLFVARWSLAEFCLVMPMLAATNSSQEVCAAILSATNSAEGKIKVVRAAVQHSNREILPNGKEDVLRVLRDFMGICTDRNNLMHHVWAVNDESHALTINFRESSESSGRTTIRSLEHLVEQSNRSLDIAYRLCSTVGSRFITQSIVEKLKLTISSSNEQELVDNFEKTFTQIGV